ncbi:unnamed protein product [Urochloa humidicola]
MASESEVSKNATILDEQEVTSHQRDQQQGVRPRISSAAAEDQQAADPLARQSSIMSLTLEELQSSLCEPGRNFGSMNMDEFMANIWNAEEFHAATGGCKEDATTGQEASAMTVPTGPGENGGGGGSGLVRQGSFALPPPLSRKTVEEVWAEINQGPGNAQADVAHHPAPQAIVQPQMGSGGGGVAAGGRQATLGEMTLEDFLVKAGVVRGTFGGGHGQAVGMVPAGGPMGHMQQAGQLAAAAPMMYQVAPANAAVYPVMGDGMGGYHNGYAGAMAVVPPPPPSQCVAPAVSPGSSDGMNAMTQAEMMSCIGNGGMVRNGGGNARKRDSPEDGCTEKTVERRQRRMIKNRESAARSRARKQAYTVELEAELNHLKEENARLKAEEKTILLSKKKMLVEKMMEAARENVSAKKSGRGLRRCGSAMW